MRIATEQARGLDPVARTQVLYSRVVLVPAGLETADEVVSESADVLRRCESFGDPWGLTMAQWLHATVLLRCSEPAGTQARDLLEQARARIARDKTLVSTLPTIEADLTLVGGRNGDDAIERIRAQLGRMIASGSPLQAGSAAEALVRMLLERGSADDLLDARGVITEWEATRLPAPIPGLDLWRLKCRAMVAKAEGNEAAYAELTRQYRELADRLDARAEII
jgi:adenylate cyclase